MSSQDAHYGGNKTDHGNIDLFFAFFRCRSSAVGSKRLFVNFYRDEEEKPYMKGIWSFTIDGHDASTLVEVSTEDLKENEIALRFVGTDEFIGDILTCTFTASDTPASDSVQLSIAGL